MCLFTTTPRRRHESKYLDRNWDDPPHRRSYYSARDTRVATLPEAAFRDRHHHHHHDRHDRDYDYDYESRRRWSRDDREYDREVISVRDPPARNYGREVVLLEPRRSRSRSVGREFERESGGRRVAYPLAEGGVARYEYRKEELRRG